MYPKNGAALCKWEETERAEEKRTHTHKQLKKPNIDNDTLTKFNMKCLYMRSMGVDTKIHSIWYKWYFSLLRMWWHI